WHAWICCHPLDVPGAEDRMSSAYATSDDGWTWDWHGTVLSARPGRWDARGARLTTVLPDGRAAYDGPASAEENTVERAALAAAAGGGPPLAAPRCGRGRWWASPPWPGSPWATAATASGTRPGWPTSATSCAPSTS